MKQLLETAVNSEHSHTCSK